MNLSHNVKSCVIIRYRFEFIEIQINGSLKIWHDSIPLHRLKFGPMSGDNWRSVLDPVGGIIFKLPIGVVETSEEKDFVGV